MKKLKLMADYGCFPLWLHSDGGTRNVDPASLPLSVELVGNLRQWSARFDAILVAADPVASRFASPAEEGRFNSDGNTLATSTAEELGPTFEVTFRDTGGNDTKFDERRRALESTVQEQQSGYGERATQTQTASWTAVGPVRPGSEVRMLEKLGATAASFLVAPHPIFGKDRVLSHPDVQRIRSQFQGKLGVVLSPSLANATLDQMLAGVQLDFAELDVRFPPAAGTIESARSRGLKIVASGLDVDHDDDVEWLASRINDASQQYQADLYVVTLVPAQLDPYEWFSHESGKHPDDLTLVQVNEVLRTHPVLVNMALGAHPPQTLHELFPEAQGSYTYAGTPRDDGGTPAFSQLFHRHKPVVLAGD